VTCEFCGSIIPHSSRLSAVQIRAIQRLKSAEAREHLKPLKKDLPLRAQRQHEACVF